VTPDETAAIEGWLRRAYAEAGETIAAKDISSAPRTYPARSGGHLRLRWPVAQMVMPAAAAAAVLLVVMTALAVPRLLQRDSGPPAAAASPTATASPIATLLPVAAPAYLLTFFGGGFQRLAIRKAQTAQVIGQTPRPSDTGFWYSIAAESSDTFIAGWNEDSYSCPGDFSYLYQITLTSHGKLAGFRRIGSPISGDIMGASISGDSIGYVLLGSLQGCGLSGTPAVSVVIRSLSTGRVTASWQVPSSWSVKTISLADGGNAIAVGAYTWSGGLHDQLLTQATFDLRSSTSGTSLVSHPAIDSQAWPSALSPGNKTLYAIVAKSGSNPRAYADPRPITFELVAISTADGRVTRVFHTWRAAWSDFTPAMTIDPSGQFLLVVNGASMARVDLASGQYAPLPTTASLAFLPVDNFQNGQVGQLDPLGY
jgi:hypothetical protein